MAKSKKGKKSSKKKKIKSEINTNNKSYKKNINNNSNKKSSRKTNANIDINIDEVFNSDKAKKNSNSRSVLDKESYLSSFDYIVSPTKNIKGKSSSSYNRDEERKNRKKINEKSVIGGRVIVSSGKRNNKNNFDVNEIKNKLNTKLALKKIFGYIILICIICLFCFGIYKFFTLEMFNVTKINVEGNINTTNEEIISLLHLSTNENILKEYFGLVTTDNKYNVPYIYDMSFALELPNTINITVSEREKFYYAFIPLKNMYYILSRDGHVLELANDLSKRNGETILSGIEFEESISLGELINEEYINKINVFEEIKKKILEDIKESTNKCTFVNSNYRINVGEKLEVIFSGTNIDYEIIVLKSIMKEIGDLPGTIDLTKNNPTFVRKN